jgi:ribonuclease Z
MRRCYTLPVDVSSLLFGHSKALYSTWVCYKPDRLLVDCGEGAATALGNSGFAIERVLLTHGHLDHISGLPSLLWSRASGMGDTEKPLAIYYPRDDSYVAAMQTYLEHIRSRLTYELQWIALDSGDSLDLSDCAPNAPESNGQKKSAVRHARRVVAFPTRHSRGQLTLGYKIVETRRRLKPEYARLAQDEIRRRAREKGRAGAHDLMEEYEATLVAFGGDGLPLNPGAVRGCELLLHEATILDPADRKHQLHSTLDEAMAVAAQARPKTLLLYHISGRYRRGDIVRAVHESAARHNVEFPVWCLFRDRLWQVLPAHDGVRYREGENR